AIAMTGLDQNMMQKNLSCRSLGEAQMNIYAFTLVVVIVNFFFLCLGALLYAYAGSKGIEVPARTDLLFPLLALEKLGAFAAIVFILGLTAATFSSADSVLTTLTTSFCIDILGMDGKAHWSEETKTRMRHRIHLAFAVILLLVILGFRAINSQAVIDAVLKIAGYTYGPLIGLFGFGLLCRWKVKDGAVPMICVLAPILCYVVDTNSKSWFSGYQFGNELLVLNGVITALGLLAFSNVRSAGPGASKTQVA
ncbi:MAG TPA: hypothetical protein VK968_12050, partial [Roseimicrobium sp.]|nr:hypothetical protein [Roseimicrobium sp.]